MKKFGLLGGKLGHSYSPIIHNEVYRLMGFEATYELLECSECELKDYIEKLRKNEYFGYNVTIPYKIEIMKYLDEISDEAKRIGSVNTVAYVCGKVIGYNTDYYGFLDTLKTYNVDVCGKNTFILGTGGASLACECVCRDLGANVIKVSRRKSESAIDYNDLEKYDSIDVLINTTPVGMYPNVLDMPISLEVCKRVKKCVDIIFNPIKTKLLSNVGVGYNGLLMLVSQAIKSEIIWNGFKDIDLFSVYKKIEGEILE